MTTRASLLLLLLLAPLLYVIFCKTNQRAIHVFQKKRTLILGLHESKSIPFATNTTMDGSSASTSLLPRLARSTNDDAGFGSGCLSNVGGVGGSRTKQHQQLLALRKTEFVPLDEEEDVDKVLSRNLYALTLEQREQAAHDIHGVADIMVETPDMVQSAKRRLRQELERIGHRSVAYQKALVQSVKYVESLYLMFLRRDAYDTSKAAARMLSHFDMKLPLWGEDKLGRDIALKDFNKHDMACLKEGFFQTLPSRDRAGRSVFCKIWYHQKYHERENVVRC